MDGPLVPDDPTGAGHPPRAWPEGFGRSPADRRALCVLLGLSSLTPRRLIALAAEAGTARACLAEVRAGRAGSPADQRAARDRDEREVFRRLAEARARLVAAGDADYPRDLEELHDPPAGLFVRGGPLPELAPRVALVGARNCSPEGREVAVALARGVGEAGWCVVSGAARGIDAAAHRGALDGPGPTIAVLGSGIDRPYPPGHRALIERIVRRGAVVSEYPPGTPAEPFRFPARNRIIAGLARAVVVVEGTAGSGSLITAEHALDLGRDVMAVPGPVFSELSAAPLALLREGAALIRGPEDVLHELGVAGTGRLGPGGVRASPAAGEWTSVPVGLADGEGQVWAALARPLPVDAVASATGLVASDVLAALVGLELRGLVVQSGGRYRRRLGSRSAST